ncbi:MAG: hypothetical protein QM809_06610 [Gordonia sp. (in: high G+C Gram-positive bacteria)]|uniref:hypothetical protein n=1 Tax=Gordonia sp. (in: high G+C Gram-positive bacteria) TaxID=84139 RepID=UPI0039E6175B
MRHIVSGPGTLATLGGVAPLVIAGIGMQNGQALLVPVWAAWIGALGFTIVNASRRQHA